MAGATCSRPAGSSATVGHDRARLGFAPGRGAGARARLVAAAEACGTLNNRGLLARVVRKAARVGGVRMVAHGEA